MVHPWLFPLFPAAPARALLCPPRSGLVLVQAKNRAAMEAAWNDDARIEKMIYELNFGVFSKERLV